MSADNMIYAMQFQRMDGEVVWRVFEAFMSSLPWDKCHAMSVQSRSRKFTEFTGSDAESKAKAMAKRVARQIPVCEYGACVEDAEDGAKTMRQLQDEAIQAGYSAEAVNELREASEDDLAQLEIEYWARWG